ncbi:MAG: aminotransferase class I/II-fold pyridoxal phosphate-dependent enzyme [Lachnospiraceae bacterium]|nr:aminotransferase class I/II-fold pyridoxal phosphate-dependent enzyme [Lachnospiraceae bacterium]
MNFSKRLDRFGEEIFAALNNKRLALEAQGKKIWNLSVGTPDFPVPEHIKKALADAAMDPENWKYSLRDLPELTEAVCSYYAKRYGVHIEKDQVMSCYGTQEGMGHLALALCDKGDTVLLPDPCYPVFQSGTFLADADPWYYPLTKENDFLPVVADIPEDVARKAKYIIVSLPANPVGAVAKPGIYEEIIEWAKKYDVLIVHDNAYSDIIFDGNRGGSFLAHQGAMEQGVEFFSLSKSFDVTGARISFLVGRKDVVDAVRLLRSQIDFGMFLPIQKAAIAALTGPCDMIEKQCADYEERRDALCQGARNIGWNIPDTGGSMFVWAPIPEDYTSSMEFCMDLLEKTGVLCTPGSGFGPHGEGYVRFALVLPPEEIKNALKSIKDSGIFA